MVCHHCPQSENPGPVKRQIRPLTMRRALALSQSPQYCGVPSTPQNCCAARQDLLYFDLQVQQYFLYFGFLSCLPKPSPLYCSGRCTLHADPTVLCEHCCYLCTVCSKASMQCTVYSRCVLKFLVSKEPSCYLLYLAYLSIARTTPVFVQWTTFSKCLVLLVLYFKI